MGEFGLIGGSKVCDSGARHELLIGYLLAIYKKLSDILKGVTIWTTTGWISIKSNKRS